MSRSVSRKNFGSNRIRIHNTAKIDARSLDAKTSVKNMTMFYAWPNSFQNIHFALVQGHVLVELDDGDSRLVDITRIRMLPHNYSRVGKSCFSSKSSLFDITRIRLLPHNYSRVGKRCFSSKSS